MQTPALTLPAQVRPFPAARPLSMTLIPAFVLALLLTGAAWALHPQRASAQAGTCADGVGPGGYDVTVCLVKPAAGATVQGVTPVGATATVTGTGAPSATVKGLWFYLAKAPSTTPRYVLQDLVAPYEWSFPSAYYVDGAYTLTAEVQMEDGFKLSVAHGVTLQNGTASTPVNPNTFTPHTPAGPITLAAVGDGAGSEPASEDVSAMILGQQPDVFLYLGDVYQRGTYSEFYNWYGTPDRLYGRLRAVTNPIVGNHEYGVKNAADYFYWWDNVPHAYSYDLGDWHLAAFDSTEQYNQFSPGTAQYDWLVNDLQTKSKPCTLVYFHHPRFSIGPQKDDPRLSDLWALLVQEGVDLTLHGHEHQYQRWVSLDSSGEPAAGGLTQIIIGTGGYDLQRPSPKTDKVAYVQKIEGALFLDLAADHAGFRFLNVAGEPLDSGTIECSDAPLPPPPLDEKVWLPLVGK